MDVQGKVLARLNEMSIAYRLLEHAPVGGILDCLPIAEQLHALMPKNLFLAPRSEKAFYLAIVPPDSVFRTADVSRQLGSARLSFASEEKLDALLHTKPGAISPMGLLFDADRRVQFAMDRALASAPILAFHPCVSTASIAISQTDFRRFLAQLRYEIHWITTKNSE